MASRPAQGECACVSAPVECRHTGRDRRSRHGTLREYLMHEQRASGGEADSARAGRPFQQGHRDGVDVRERGRGIHCNVKLVCLHWPVAILQGSCGEQGRADQSSSNEAGHEDVELVHHAFIKILK